jgi:hypothetical protein
MGYAANIVDVTGQDVQEWGGGGVGIPGASLISLIIRLEFLLMKHDTICCTKNAHYRRIQKCLIEMLTSACS